MIGTLGFVSLSQENAQLKWTKSLKKKVDAN